MALSVDGGVGDSLAAAATCLVAAAAAPCLATAALCLAAATTLCLAAAAAAGDELARHLAETEGEMEIWPAWIL